MQLNADLNRLVINRIHLFVNELLFFIHLLIIDFCKIESYGLFALKPCLLYTSDAADERSSVDLGGRRIIKKKIEHYTDRCSDA